MAEIPNHPDAREGETAYEWHDDAQVAFQRPCDAGCDRGLLLSPARFCTKCGGSGYLVRIVEEATQTR